MHLSTAKNEELDIICKKESTHWVLSVFNLLS